MSTNFLKTETPQRTIRAVSVEGSQRRKPSNHVVYSIKVVWSDGTVNIIYRRFSEVIQLEHNLLESFASDKRWTSIPSVHGKIYFGLTSVHSKVKRIRYFIQDLIALPEHISQCELVTGFFTPRSEDLESVVKKGSRRKRKSKFNPKKSVLRKISSRKSKTARSIGAPVLLEQYVAIENYQKQYHNDISLTKEYTVGVIEKHESGWWHVDCEGDIGWVPASYIKPVYSGDHDDDDIVTERFPPGHEELYMTTRSYQAKKDDEISFSIGVNLQVIEKTLDGWWRVRYRNKEGWAPAVYLRRVGIAAPNKPNSLKRLTGKGVQLRDEQPDLNDVLKEEIQERWSSGLTPNLDVNFRRHSFSEQLEVFRKTSRDHERSWNSVGDLKETICGQRNGTDSLSLEFNTKEFTASGIVSKRTQLEVQSQTEENEDRPMSRCRSASTGDLREALPNRGLFLSELDLRLAHCQEENRSASEETVKGNRSRSFSGNIKSLFGQIKGSDSMSSKEVSTNFSKPAVEYIKAPVEEFFMAKENQARSLSRRCSASTGEIRGELTNCGLSISDIDLQLALRKEGVSKRSRSLSFLGNVKNLFRQSSGSDSPTSAVSSNRGEVEESSQTTDSEEVCLSMSRSVSLRDLRDALPNRGLFISAFDLQLAHREEEKHPASEPPIRNNSFGVSDNMKRFITQKKVVARAATLSPVLSRLYANSKRRFSDIYDITSSNPELSSNSSGHRDSTASLPSIWITPPTDEKEEPLFTKKHDFTLGNSMAFEANPHPIIEPHEITQEGQAEKRQILQTDKKESTFGLAHGLLEGTQQKRRGHLQQEQELRSDEKQDNGIGEDGGKDEEVERKRRIRKVSVEEKQENTGADSLSKADATIYYAVATYDASGDDEVAAIEEDYDIGEDRGKDEDVVTRRRVKEVLIKEKQGNPEANGLSEAYSTIYYAVATYEASGYGEVTAIEGDEVKVLARAPNGWWMVRIDDTVGWVPSNFLVAGESQDEEDNENSVESDLDQENGGLYFDNEAGDVDEHEHEDDDEDDDDDEEENDCMQEVKDVGKSKVWPKLTPHLNHYRKNRRKAGGPSILCFDNDYPFGGFAQTRETIKKSTRTSPKSSTESSSSASDMSPRYELRRRTNNKYEEERVHTSRSFYKEAVYRSQKWGQRFKAMSSAGPSSNLHNLHSTEVPRFPLKRQRVLSYDSGCPEDERTNFSLRAARENHYTNPRAYRRYYSQGISSTMQSSFNFRPKIRSSSIPPADESTDDEAFPEMRNHLTNEDSLDDNLVFLTYTPQYRRRHRSKSRYPAAIEASYGRSKGHRRQIYQAIANYHATADGTIDLFEGDKVQVIRKSKGGWWLVQIEDEYGWAPSNYLQPFTCYGD